MEVNQAMATDLIIDANDNDTLVVQAVSEKYPEYLDDERVVEKIKLERRYWETEKVDWFLFTESEVLITLIKKIEWFIPYVFSFQLNTQVSLAVVNYGLKIIRFGIAALSR